jgi:Na+/melibiose symporter-like transporter
MPELYPWWVYLHVLGAFVFAFAHGTTMVAAIHIRSTRDLGEVRTLLNLSQVAIGVMYGGLALLLIGGIAAGIVGNHFGSGWIWAAIVLLVLTIVAMYLLATPFYRRLRVAVGANLPDPRMAEGTPPTSPAELEAILGSNRPMVLAAVGLIGFVVILWLMLFKPF